MSITINGNGTISGVSVGGLPDGIVDTDMIAANAVTAAKSSGLGGITMADQWRISSGLNGVSSSTYITANWERVDTDGFGQLGTGMTESSGEFTFPSTGIYHIDIRGRGSKGNGEVQYAGLKIHVTTDGSNYNEAANSFQGSGGTGYYYAIGCQHILDVTNTSTHKVKFQFEASHPADLHGNTNYTDTGVTFIRLGDT